MKRFAALLLALCLLASCAGCAGGSKEKITMQKLMAVNSREKLLSMHQNYACTHESAYGARSEFFVEKDYVFVDFLNGTAVKTDGTEEWYCIDDNMKQGKSPIAYRWYAMGDEEKAKRQFDVRDYKNLFDPVVSPQETIVGQKAEGDVLAVTTLLETEKIYQDTPAESFPEAVRASDHVKSVYRVDRKTLELRSITCSTLTGETEAPYYTLEVSYDAPQPSRLSKLLEVEGKAVDAPQEEKQTFTVVYDPGTAKEERYSVSLPKGQPLLLEHREGYELYSDPAKTRLFDGNVGTEDVTIYGFPTFVV